MLHTDSLQRVSETEMCPCEEKLGFLLWCFEMGYLKETSCCLVSRELRCFEDYCQLPRDQRVTVVWEWLSTIHVRVNKMYCVCIYFCWGSFDSHETLWVYVMINVWLFTGLSFKFGVSKYLTFIEHHQCGKLKFYMIVMRFNWSVQFSSVQDGMCALGKAHMRSTRSLRSFPNVAFETVPMFVWLMMAQTPGTGLRHPSFNHCRIYSRHRVQKTVS